MELKGLPYHAHQIVNVVIWKDYGFIIANALRLAPPLNQGEGVPR